MDNCSPILWYWLEPLHCIIDRHETKLSRSSHLCAAYHIVRTFIYFTSYLSHSPSSMYHLHVLLRSANAIEMRIHPARHRSSAECATFGSSPWMSADFILSDYLASIMIFFAYLPQLYTSCSVDTDSEIGIFVVPCSSSTTSSAPWAKCMTFCGICTTPSSAPTDCAAGRSKKLLLDLAPVVLGGIGRRGGRLLRISRW